MLFNEPKLLKFVYVFPNLAIAAAFSALQRAEIAEMQRCTVRAMFCISFSALQRAEIAEIVDWARGVRGVPAFQCSSTSRNC